MDFKPTKWKLMFCVDCNRPSDWKCKDKKHYIVERENAPFFVPDMNIEHISSDGKMVLSSHALNVKFYSNSKCLKKIIFNAGISIGGLIGPALWQYHKHGERYPLMWLKREKVDDTKV